MEIADHSASLALPHHWTLEETSVIAAS